MKSKIPSDESQTKDGRMEKTGVDGVFAVLGRLFFLLMFVAVPFLLRAQLIVTRGTQLPAGWTAESLVSNVLLGSGVEISNVRFNGSTNVRGSNAIGMFSTGDMATNLGMEEGLILGTGDVSIAVGPNDDVGASDWEYDDSYMCVPLENITPGLTNQAVLEFDFVPSSDSIKFEYIFGSEEYPEYVCSSYNDVFGFFLSGQNPSGGTYNNRNIALLPNTNIPIAINNVNGGESGWWGGEEDCDLSNSEYYVDNTDGDWVQYNGYTVQLTASARVVPHTTYHLMIAIADASDNMYDSGVFLKANSLTAVTDTIYDTVCYGECYHFFGDTLCNAGTYVHEQDLSIITLYLYVRDYPLHQQNDTIVENQLPWQYAGRWYSTAVQNDSITLTDPFGCDSMIVYNLYVFPNSYTEVDTAVCSADTPIEWYGHVFRETGVVCDTLASVSGADSVVVYRLKVNPSYSIYDTVAVCEGVVYEYDGRQLSSQATYRFQYSTAESCDSSLYIHLQVYDNPESHIHIEPAMADVDNQIITLFDQSSNAAGCEWYINGEPYGTASMVNYSYPFDLDSVTVQLITRNGLDCRDTGYAVIHLDRCMMWIPNVFTPDHDINTHFFAVAPCMTEMEMWIYNRDGLQVFHTTDIGERWDGKSQRTGEKCPTGSYVYTMNYRMSNYPDVRRSSTGIVILLR